MDLPLFPLHTVLCPGVTLPLHVFEERYKTMVERCLAERTPFGIVLIREGREVGRGDIAVAAVGTVAEIREATRYADGRYDLVIVGTHRFRVDAVDPDLEPYLVGTVTPLGEALGEPGRARTLAERVVQLFIRYLERLQVDDAPAGSSRTRRGGPSSDVPADEIPGAPDRPDVPDAGAAADAFVADLARTDAGPGGRAAGRTGAGREALDALDDAARRLAIPDDPTVLSYLLSGIVQVESVRRQGLLEMPTTELRLADLAQLLEREIALLGRGLGSYAPDPRLSALRRN